MRTALLPTPGDPFMLAYWLRNFETWRDEVDALVVLVNGQRDPVIVEQLRGMVDAAGGSFASIPNRVGHDGALRWLLTGGDGDYVVLCEDDAYVRRPLTVDRAFRRIEDGYADIVGSPRHEDYVGQRQEWDTYKPGDLAELRHGLWPAFLFARRADLLATDRVYGDRRWNIGQTIEGWGPVTREACEYVGVSPDYVHLDTLFGTTFQLRAKGLRADLVHHVRLFDAAATEQWIAEDPPWFHVTGLSTLDYVLDGRTDLPDLDATGGLWTRRVAWWLRTTRGLMQVPGCGERMRALVAFADRVGIRAVDLNRWDWLFDPWVTWAETNTHEKGGNRHLIPAVPA